MHGLNSEQQLLQQHLDVLGSQNLSGSQYPLEVALHELHDDVKGARVGVNANVLQLDDLLKGSVSHCNSWREISYMGKEQYSIFD